MATCGLGGCGLPGAPTVQRAELPQLETRMPTGDPSKEPNAHPWVLANFPNHLCPSLRIHLPFSENEWTPLGLPGHVTFITLCPPLQKWLASEKTSDMFKRQSLRNISAKATSNQQGWSPPRGLTPRSYTPIKNFQENQHATIQRLQGSGSHTQAKPLRPLRFEGSKGSHGGP